MRKVLLNEKDLVRFPSQKKQVADELSQAQVKLEVVIEIEVL